MNSFVHLSVLLIASANLCLAATFIELNAINKDHPGKCYDVATKHAWSPGESYTPIGRCFNLYCSAPGQIQGSSCGKVATPPKCREIEPDMTRPHPYCCDRFVCPDDGGKLVVINPSVSQSGSNSHNNKVHTIDDIYSNDL